MPPMIVAPERDVPGISANACASPTFSASVQRIASMSSMRTTPGARRCRRSTQRMTSAPATNASATGIGANSTALIALPNSRPSTAAGTNAIATLTAKRCATGCREEPGEHARETRAELPADGEDRAGLDDDLEHLGVIAGVAEQRAGDDQMSGRRDRQELGETLDDAEDERDEQRGMFQCAGSRATRRRKDASELSHETRGVPPRVDYHTRACAGRRGAMGDCGRNAARRGENEWQGST